MIKYNRAFYDPFVKRIELCAHGRWHVMRFMFTVIIIAITILVTFIPDMPRGSSGLVL